MEVTVLNRQRGHRVDRQALTDFIRKVAGHAPAEGADSLAVCLVSDRRMRELNRQYRGKDRATDVLSFAGGEAIVPEESGYLGDIVISVETAARQADAARHGLQRELKILALHGYLHLIGHDHERDKGTMLRLQDRLVRRLLPPAARSSR